MDQEKDSLHCDYRGPSLPNAPGLDGHATHSTLLLFRPESPKGYRTE